MLWVMVASCAYLEFGMWLFGYDTYFKMNGSQSLGGGKKLSGQMRIMYVQSVL